MDLPLFSGLFLAFALTLYAVLDGFDLGVGILLLFQPGANNRNRMVDSITPTWDGNETWIIMAGATMFAAFPAAYSILLPALYIPVILMLLALGFRGVSFEFRMQARRHWRAWDFAFAAGSLVASFMQGAIVGAVIQGVRVRELQFAGSVLDVFRPFPLISGAAVVFGYAVVGGGWLKLKSNASLQEFARKSLRISVPVFAALFGTACIYAVDTQPGIQSEWSSHRIVLASLIGLFVLAAGTLAASNENNGRAIPFCLGVVLLLLGIAGTALIVFPDIVPFNLSLWEAASSSASQIFVLVGAAFVAPVVLGYSAFAYWIFRGKTPEEGWEQ